MLKFCPCEKRSFSESTSLRMLMSKTSSFIVIVIAKQLIYWKLNPSKLYWKTIEEQR